MGELTRSDGGHVGGVERQVSLMARWFAGDGYQVSMVTWADRLGDAADTGGVKLISVCRRDAGLWGVRFVHPRWTRLNRALREADADLYYHNCGECVTGQVALWCRRRRRKFVYSVANDADCDSRLPEMHTLRERILYRYGLRRADAVITQTWAQRRMLLMGFGRDSVVIPMPCPGPSAGRYTPPSLTGAGPMRVLWIGRICRQKRPDHLLEVAQACPDVAFDMVGPVGSDSYGRRVAERAERVDNVTVHGSVGRERVSEFYRRAVCMVSTSDFEGFPNTFLEAWSYGLPLVSTFDPDQRLIGNDMGVVAGDVDGLAEGLRGLLDDPNRHRRLSDNARKYYLRTHTVEAVMPQFRRVFTEVLEGAGEDAQ